MFWEEYFPDTVLNPGALDVPKTGESRCMWVQKNMLIDWTTWWHHRILGQACVISLQFVSLSLFLLPLLKLCSKALDPGSCKYRLTMPIFVKLPIHGHCCYFTKIFRIRNCSRINCEQWRNRLVSRPVVFSVRLHGILYEDYNTVVSLKWLLNFLLSGMMDPQNLWGGSCNTDTRF